MEKSGEYIDYKAYIRYLRKVTGTPADPDGLRQSILSKSGNLADMHTAYNILKWLIPIVFAALLIAICLAVIW